MNKTDLLSSSFEVTSTFTGEQVLNVFHEFSDPQVLDFFSIIDEWREDIDFTLKACNVFLNELLKFHHDEMEYYTRRNIEDAFVSEVSIGPLYQEDLDTAQKAIDLILKFQAEYKQLTD